MADIIYVHNIGSEGTTRRMSPAGTGAQTAGATATVTGVTIDRGGFSGGSLPRSAEFAALFDTTLASGKTLSVYFDVQHSTNNSTFTDFATQAATLAATGPSGGGAVQGAVSFNVDLGGAYRYIRLLTVPTLSATGTDTCTFISTGFFAGFDRLASPT